MKAIIAVAASMLRSVHAMLTRGETYQDLGANHHPRRHRTRLANRLLRRLDELGVQVTSFELDAAWDTPSPQLSPLADAVSP